MKTKSVLAIFLGMLLASGNPMMAQRLEEPVNLEKIYKQIDEAIEMSPLYVKQRVEHQHLYIFCPYLRLQLLMFPSLKTNQEQYLFSL